MQFQCSVSNDSSVAARAKRRVLRDFSLKYDFQCDDFGRSAKFRFTVCRMEETRRVYFEYTITNLKYTGPIFFIRFDKERIGQDQL